jgi:ribonuclease R
MVHRLLMASLTGQEPSYGLERLREIAEQCSTSERKAMVVERGSKDLDRCFVAAAHLGQLKKATITSFTNFGIFAALESPFIEGLIPIQMLGDDYFELDEHGAFMRGRRTGKTFHLGMPIEVEIAAVNLERRLVDLRPARAEESVESGLLRAGGAPAAQRPRPHKQQKQHKPQKRRGGKSSRGRKR